MPGAVKMDLRAPQAPRPSAPTPAQAAWAPPAVASSASSEVPSSLAPSSAATSASEVARGCAVADDDRIRYTRFAWLNPSSTRLAMWFLASAGGSIACLVLYGLLQERIMQVPYDGQLFRYSVFLVFLNRFGGVLFSLCMVWAHGDRLKNQAPLWTYGVVSISNVMASCCQYEALKYVSFAVQMLGKSFKMMPVMVWSMIITGRAYGWEDWCIATAVTVGIVQFLITGPTTLAGPQASTIHGLLLLAMFLLSDGLTSTMQEKLFREYKTTKSNQMFYINAFSMVICGLSMLCEGESAASFSFFLAHAAFRADASLLCVAAVAGQAFNYSLVQDFGALVFAATMNLRQVASIMASYAVYGHHMAALQAAGLGLVFTALACKVYRDMAGGGAAAGRLIAERRRLNEEKAAFKTAYSSAASSKV